MSQGFASSVGAPTHFGLMVVNYTSTEEASAAFEYFRVYEADLDV